MWFWFFFHHLSECSFPVSTFSMSQSNEPAEMSCDLECSLDKDAQAKLNVAAFKDSVLLSSVLRPTWPPLETHFLQCWEVSKSQLRVVKLLISKSIKILNYFESSCLFNYIQEKHLSSTFIQSTKFEIRHSVQHRPNQCLNQCEWLFLKRWMFDSLIKANN